MVKPAKGFKDVFVFDTDTFSQFWGEWIKDERFDDTQLHQLKPEDNWTEIHKYWREFVMGAWEVISNLEDNKWTKTWTDFEDEDKVFKYFSPKCYNKIRSIQKTLAQRDDTPWMLVFKKTKKGAQRIDWIESTLPPAPFGMECKKPTPPLRKQPQTSVWDKVASYFM